MTPLLLALLCAFFAFAVGQNLASLPACGQACVTSVSAAAVGGSGCPPADASCYCSSYAFADKVDSCANKSCNTASDLASINSYLNSYCGTSSSSTSSTSTSISPTSSASNTTVSQTSSSQSSGLSSGAKVGIAIGALLATAAIASLLSELLIVSRRRRRRDKEERQAESTRQFVSSVEAKAVAASASDGLDQFDAVRDAEAARLSKEASRTQSTQEIDSMQKPKKTLSRKVVARQTPVYELGGSPVAEMESPVSRNS